MREPRALNSVRVRRIRILRTSADVPGLFHEPVPSIKSRSRWVSLMASDGVDGAVSVSEKSLAKFEACMQPVPIHGVA
jgi:hypothetical protein